MKTQFTKTPSRGFTISEILLAIIIMVGSLAFIAPALAVRSDFQNQRDISNACQIAACYNALNRQKLISEADGTVHSVLAHRGDDEAGRSAHGSRPFFQLCGFTVDELNRAEKFLRVRNGVLVCFRSSDTEADF